MRTQRFLGFTACPQNDRRRRLAGGERPARTTVHEAVVTSSYWIDSAQLPSHPKLARDLDVDVIVIGAGITGITAAYLAKKEGKTVALIDRAQCASIDTGHTTAHLTAVTDVRLQEIARHFTPDAARAVWDAGSAAIDEIVKLIRREDIDCDFHWMPGYLHAPLRNPDPKRIEELEKEAALAQELGIPAEMIARIPLFQVPGVRFKHQAVFHPRKYLAALLQSIDGGGSHVCEETSVDEITDDPLTVTCGAHRIRGRHLVLATHTPLQGTTGTLSALLFQTKLALYTSYVVAGKAPQGRLPRACFWDNDEPYDYLRIEPHEDHDYVIFGGEDHKTGQAADTEARFARLERRLRDYVPDVSIDRRWSGQVIETNDGLPFIGETAPNQFAATGYAGNGMTFGTLGAMMAVDRIMGRTNPWQDLFDINRKKLLGGTWSYLVENSDYPYYLLRDRAAKEEGDSTADVPRGEGKILKLKGHKVAAHRDEAGKLTLCSPVCTHLKCTVAWNPSEKTWDCPCHGSRFKPNGEVISGPAEEPLEQIRPT
jgi:glycine/D-amino acid oxidase-like deaminating enzyme/nitrite reductase/ring-hydroxylating ferredoxin subunit